MEQFLQYNSWYDVKDSNMTPNEVSFWTDLITTKKIIDDIFSDIEDQLLNCKNLGLNYLSEILNLKYYDNEEIKQYVIDKKIDVLTKLSSIFNIPNLENILTLPSEVQKYFDIIYNNIVINLSNELSSYLIFNNYDTYFENGKYTKCRNLVLKFLQNAINANLNLISRLEDLKIDSAENIVKHIEKRIKEYEFIKNIIQSSNSQKIAQYFKNYIDSV